MGFGMTKRLTAQTLVRDAISGYCFFEGDDPVIPHVVRYGRNPLVVLTGSNGGGKSLFRKVIGLACKDVGLEFIHLSMEGRTGGVMGAMTSFVYGSENWEATGLNSARTVTTGIKTCHGREHDHVIFWDEPDTGMSDELASGTGKLILNFALKKPKRTKAIFVVSHNRYLMRKLAAAKPHFIHMGRHLYNSLEEWATRPVEPADVQAAIDEGIARFRRISAMTKRK